MLRKPTEKAISSQELRKQAEHAMQTHTDILLEPSNTNQVKLLHELQIHKIELEMQNEALIEALVKIEDACFTAEPEHDRYLELFDFAPIAYFKLAGDHVIQKANYCGSRLLGVERSLLIGQDFSRHISFDYRSDFQRFMDDILTEEYKPYCELELKIAETCRWVTIHAICDKRHESYLMAVSDISERKRNEEKLRESHAFIASILNSMHQQIAVLDMHGIILSTNNAWLEFSNESGFQENNQTMLGANYLDACKNGLRHFTYADSMAAYHGILAILCKELQIFTMEYSCDFNNRERWYKLTASPLKYPHYGAVVSHENITERKLAERLPNLLKAMFDISMDGFWEFDLLGNFISVNQTYAEMSGYSMSELAVMRISQLEVVEDIERINSQLAKVVEYGYSRFETCHRRKDGQIIAVEIAAAYLPEFKTFCAFCRDISHRKQADGKLNAIFNASVEGIISFNLYNTIISANPAIETIFGYKAEELNGKKISLLVPSLPKCKNACGLLGAIKQSPKILEIEGIHKNGRTLPLELTRTEYTINNACYFVVIIRDVSLRKQREMQDKAHLDELAHIGRLGLMGEMASGIAHEVNQPLTAICSYTQAGIDLINSENHNLEELNKILMKIQQQALRSGQIIHRMREFIKSSPQQLSTVEINALVLEAVNLCSDDILQYNVKLVLGFENDLPPVSAAHIHIEQVIINLIRNSIDVLQAMPHDQPRQLSIQTQLTDQNGIQVRVKDNGPGMDQVQQAKILTPFYTTKKTGMGMGLAICRSLIEAHNGTLRFCSKPGKGTTFYFTLPTRV